MSYAQVSIPGDGSTTLVPVEFALGAISPSMVRCYVTGELDGGGGQLYRTFTFTTSTMVQVDGAPCPVGQFYIFERTVPKDELIVDWTDGDPITGENLDKMQKHSLHMAHEALDLGDRAIKAPVGSAGRDFTASTLDATLIIDPATGDIVSGPTATEVSNAQQYALDAAASAAAAAGIVDDAIDAATVAGTAAGTVAGQAAANAAVATHVADLNNPHAVTKAQVGLGSVDDVSAAALRDRTTHTGEQAITTVTGLQTALDSKATQVDMDAAEAAIATKANSADLTAHTTNTSNPHNVTKAQVGLGNVDNTSDANKPVSTATQTALNAKQSTSEKGAANGYASLGSDGKVPSSQLPVSGSYKGSWNAATNTPTITSGVGVNGDFYIVGVAGTTNIDGTASWAVGDQIRFNGTVWQKIANSNAVSSVNGQTGVVVLTKTDIGLGNVDNTSDANKPVSTATQTALNAKADTTALADYVPKTGATMTGELVFPANLGTRLDSATPGARRHRFSTNNVMRWQLGADGTPEGGSNAGTNFVLQAYDDAGTFLGNAFSIERATRILSASTGIAIAGSFTSTADPVITRGFPQIRLNKTANNQTSSIAGQLNGLNLWNLVLGTSSAAGDFHVNAYDDAGVFLATRFNMNRLTGDIALNGSVIIAGRTNPSISLRKTAASENSALNFQRSDGTTAWIVTHTGDADSPPSGIAIKRRNASGGAIDYPLTISETDGAVTLAPNGLTTALGSFKYIKSILLPTSTDLDTITDAAPCYTGVGLVNGPISMSGTQWAYVEVKRFSNDANYVLQTFTFMNLGGGDQFPAKWERRKYAGAWGSWYPVSGFVTPAHFGCAGSTTAAGATSGETVALISFLNSPRPKMLDRWYRLAGVANIDMDLQGQNGYQLFGLGGQSGLVMAGGAINLTNADVPNPTGTISDLVTLRDFMMVKVGYDATVPLTVAFKDGDTGSSMPSLHMENVHLTCATNTDGCSGASIALHNVRNSVVNNASVFGRYGTYNGNGFQLSGGANSASVEVYFNNCRANHVQKGWVVLPSGGAVANDDMQGIHWEKCTAIAVDRGWDISSTEGFSEWFHLNACHAYFRECGVITSNAGNVRSSHGYYLGHGSLATCQGIAITGTSIEPWNSFTENRIRLDAATGATRIGINANVQSGFAIGNKVTNATTPYIFAGTWTNSGNA